MAIDSIRIEESLLKNATSLRRQEWDTIITDIFSGDPPFPSRGPCELLVGLDDVHVRLSFMAGSSPLEVLTCARTEMAPLINEYVDLIKRLSGGDVQSAQWETLDMAKRVVHDAGGRKLGALLPGIGSSLETRRRMFSLVVSILVDTTKFGAYPAHRRK